MKLPCKALLTPVQSVTWLLRPRRLSFALMTSESLSGRHFTGNFQIQAWIIERFLGRDRSLLPWDMKLNPRSTLWGSFKVDTSSTILTNRTDLEIIKWNTAHSSPFSAVLPKPSGVGPPTKKIPQDSKVLHPQPYREGYPSLFRRPEEESRSLFPAT